MGVIILRGACLYSMDKEQEGELFNNDVKQRLLYHLLNYRPTKAGRRNEKIKQALKNCSLLKIIHFQLNFIC
jgi:hypothetical protein